MEKNQEQREQRLESIIVKLEQQVEKLESYLFDESNFSKIKNDPKMLVKLYKIASGSLDIAHKQAAKRIKKEAK